MQMALMFTHSWRIEGQHSQTKKAVGRAPCHAGPYVSLKHRMPQIRSAIEQSPDFLGQRREDGSRVKIGSTAMPAKFLQSLFDSFVF